MYNKQTITGVVLTLNEEKDLPRALRSLAWCDQLFVVDSGSTDHTCDVAEKFGARFVQHIQSSPFLITKQRNWALDEIGTSTDWVLFLDADEEVGEALADQIRLSVNLTSCADAYELTPRYWFFGRWLRRTQGFPNWHPRLLRTGSVRFEGGVWESFTQPAKVQRINEPYEHYAFSKGLDDWLERHIRYANWESDKILDYLGSNKNKKMLSTTRHLKVRTLAAILWPFRPILRFFQKYIIQAGFTEGWQGLVFALMMSMYELITVIKVLEKLQKKT